MRVAVLEDHVLTRAGIVATLQESGLEVLAAVDDVDALLKSIAFDPVDAVLLDVRLPPTYTTEGLNAAARVRREYPSTAALVLSAHLEVEYATTLLASGTGGLGYLLKDRILEPVALVDALRRVVAGECVIDPAIIAELLAQRHPFDLTEREMGCWLASPKDSPMSASLVGSASPIARSKCTCNASSPSSKSPSMWRPTAACWLHLPTCNDDGRDRPLLLARGTRFP